MAVYGSSRIQFLWDRLAGILFIHRRKVEIESLPDDIIIDILIRLPVDSFLDCREVCKRWRALTSKLSLTELQLKLKPSPVVILAQTTSRDSTGKWKIRRYIIDERFKRDKPQLLDKCLSFFMPKKPAQMCESIFVCSCNGLMLLLRPESWQRIIRNPVTHEEITLPKPPKRYQFIRGFYFHSLTGDYRLLYEWIGEVNEPYRFAVFSLQTISWRVIPGSTDYSIPLRDHITANENLHWIVPEWNTDYPIALRLNTHTEDFDTMPLPNNCCVQREQNIKTELLETDQQYLRLCYVYPGKRIDIWMQEDYSNWDWVQRFRVNLEWDTKRYPFYGGHKNECTKLISIQNAELLLDWWERGLFVYNLQRNTIRKIGKSDFETGAYWGFFSYSKSLVSPRNFQ